MSLARVVIILIVFARAVTLRAEDKLADDVAAIVRPRIERNEAVGIVVGVVREGRTDVFGFGRPSVDDDQPPDGRTLFEIGSITKVFTAITMADMAQAGLVSLDEPVQSLLKGAVIVPEYNGRAITLRNLATHSSGLPSVIPKVVARGLIGKDPYADVTVQDMADFLKTYKLPRQPGVKYAYSNLGAGLLGSALAARAEMSYENLIITRVCSPLGMLDTCITIDAAREWRMARGYTAKGMPTKPWTFDAFAGAGALHSTANDMLRFINANLAIAPAPGTLRAAIDTALTPRSATSTDRIKIALGWHILEATPEQPEIVWHNGGTGGFRSFIGFVRAKKVGVVVLSNSDASVDAAGLKVIDRLLRD